MQNCHLIGSVSPFKIIDINDNNTRLKLKSNKLKVVNIAQIKPYVEEATKHLSEDDSHTSQSDQCLSQDDPSLSQYQTKEQPKWPVTKAFKKLIDFKNPTNMAISFLQYELQEECDGNMFAENYNKYHCQIVTMESKLLPIFLQNKSVLKTGSRHFQTFKKFN